MCQLKERNSKTRAGRISLGIHCTQAECGYPTQFTISRDFELIMPGLWCKHLEFAPKCRPCRVAVVGGPRLNAFRKNFVIRIVGGAG